MNEDQVRAAMTTVETAMTGLATHGNEENRAALSALAASWTQLVGALALEPAPELRACPNCGQPARMAASLCGFCWTKLVPVERPGNAGH